MGILFVLFAAVLTSISNFCMRRSIDAGGSSKGYLVVQLTFSFVIMIVLNPVRTGDYGWTLPSVLLGAVGGILLGWLMWGLGKTLEKGPPGLSFAFLNASSVMPAIVMALLLGAAFGHGYTWLNGVGSILVVLGLFWAGWTSTHNPHRKVWLYLVLMIFVAHTLLLVFFQWWALILTVDPLGSDLPRSPFLPFHIDIIHTQWFMPTILFVAAALQWGIYIKNQRKIPKKAEVFYGILGGITNGACTFFLILAPQMASSWENAMLFPIFSVSIIILCNLWAQWLYHERVNWWANLVCVFGLAVGTMIWN